MGSQSNFRKWQKVGFFIGQQIDTATLGKTCRVIFDTSNPEPKFDVKTITYVGRDSQNQILNTNDKTIILIPLK